jgi:hexosaminidase
MVLLFSYNVTYFSLYGVRVENLSCGLKVDEVNGGLFYFEPIPNEFKGIAIGEFIICTFFNKHWTVAKTDFFLNWYLSSHGSRPKIIRSTKEEGKFVKDFDTPAKWKRSNDDQWNPFTPEERYEMYERTNKRRSKHRIVPKPLHVTENENETFAFDRKSWVIIHSREFPFETQYLSGNYHN